MTPREMTRDQTDSPGEPLGKPFSFKELVLHGKPNWPAALFFTCIAALHAYIAIHSYESSLWAGVISTLLGSCFILVAVVCALAHNEITICPQERQIHLCGGLGKWTSHRAMPFTAVRGVRVTLWQSRRGPQSRLEILCNGEEIPCPSTKIPRQQALYLALVMNVRLIKITDEPASTARVNQQSDLIRW